jgi:hypothetical protein
LQSLSSSSDDDNDDDDDDDDDDDESSSLDDLEFSPSSLNVDFVFLSPLLKENLIRVVALLSPLSPSLSPSDVDDIALLRSLLPKLRISFPLGLLWLSSPSPLPLPLLLPSPSSSVNSTSDENDDELSSSSLGRLPPKIIRGVVLVLAMIFVKKRRQASRDAIK